MSTSNADLLTFLQYARGQASEELGLPDHEEAVFRAQLHLMETAICHGLHAPMMDARLESLDASIRERWAVKGTRSAVLNCMALLAEGVGAAVQVMRDPNIREEKTSILDRLSEDGVNRLMRRLTEAGSHIVPHMEAQRGLIIAALKGENEAIHEALNAAVAVRKQYKAELTSRSRDQFEGMAANALKLTALMLNRIERNLTGQSTSLPCGCCEQQEEDGNEGEGRDDAASLPVAHSSAADDAARNGEQAEDEEKMDAGTGHKDSEDGDGDHYNEPQPSISRGHGLDSAVNGQYEDALSSPSGGESMSNYRDMAGAVAAAVDFLDLVLGAPSSSGDLGDAPNDSPGPRMNSVPANATPKCSGRNRFTPSNARYAPRNEDDEEDNEMDSPSLQLFTCSHCGKIFQELRRLNVHKGLKHKDEWAEEKREAKSRTRRARSLGVSSADRGMENPAIEAEENATSIKGEQHEGAGSSQSMDASARRQCLRAKRGRSYRESSFSPSPNSLFCCYCDEYFEPERGLSIHKGQKHKDEWAVEKRVRRELELALRVRSRSEGAGSAMRREYRPSEDADADCGMGMDLGNWAPMDDEQDELMWQMAKHVVHTGEHAVGQPRDGVEHDEYEDRDTEEFQRRDEAVSQAGGSNAAKKAADSSADADDDDDEAPEDTHRPDAGDGIVDGVQRVVGVDAGHVIQADEDIDGDARESDVLDSPDDVVIEAPQEPPSALPLTDADDDSSLHRDTRDAVENAGDGDEAPLPTPVPPKESDSRKSAGGSAPTALPLPTQEADPTSQEDPQVAVASIDGDARPAPGVPPPPTEACVSTSREPREPVDGAADSAEESDLDAANERVRILEAQLAAAKQHLASIAEAKARKEASESKARHDATTVAQEAASSSAKAEDTTESLIEASDSATSGEHEDEEADASPVDAPTEAPNFSEKAGGSAEVSHSAAYGDEQTTPAEDSLEVPQDEVDTSEAIDTPRQIRSRKRRGGMHIEDSRAEEHAEVAEEEEGWNRKRLRSRSRTVQHDAEKKRSISRRRKSKSRSQARSNNNAAQGAGESSELTEKTDDAVEDDQPGSSATTDEPEQTTTRSSRSRRRGNNDAEQDQGVEEENSSRGRTRSCAAKEAAADDSKTKKRSESRGSPPRTRSQLLSKDAEDTRDGEDTPKYRTRRHTEKTDSRGDEIMPDTSRGRSKSRSRKDNEKAPGPTPNDTEVEGSPSKRTRRDAPEANKRNLNVVNAVVKGDELLERTRKQRLAIYKTESVFEEYPQMKKNVNILLADFASQLPCKSLKQLLISNDQLWDALPKFEKKLDKEQRVACKAMLTRDDHPEVLNLLYLTAYLNGSQKAKKLERIRSLYRKMDDSINSPWDAIKKLKSEKLNQPLIFKLKNNDRTHYLSIDGVAIPIDGGIRVAVLAVVAATLLFDVHFCESVKDVVSFFYKEAGACTELTPTIARACEIVRRA